MHIMFSRFCQCLTFTVCVPVLLPAQGRDPMHEISEIARSIDEQLQEIDRLLLESSKKNQVRSQPKELLQKARERSETVEGGIDKLIEKLNEMKQQGGGSSSPSENQDKQPQDQQQGQPQGQPKGSSQNRRENQTPDYVPQKKEQGDQPGAKPEPKPGDQQPQPSEGSPQGGQETPSPGENKPGNRQLEPETAAGQPGQGTESWGELQPYVNFLKNRGSAPTVPVKYRKYWEAYLRQKQGKPGGK